MAVNVTQKDAILNEIIRWCETHHVTRVSHHDMYANGYNQAMENAAAHCRKHLGYSGVMPLEVPNQSEGADQLIMKETANERDQRRDHMDDHL